MNILITGAKGFVGKNLVASLNNIKLGKDKTRCVEINDIFEFDVDTPKEFLEKYCQKTDFVFHLAGVNRPKDEKEFMAGNYGFTNELLEILKKYNNKAPIMISSSIQAALDNPYGRSKKAEENVIFTYGKENNVKILIYRFPNLFGKWCRPNYNSVVATFCYNIANDLEITINDKSHVMTLCYIDDVVDELIKALENKENRIDEYCYIPVEYKKTLGEIAELLYKFNGQSKTLAMPEMPKDSFEKKLYSTYLSYFPEKKIKFPLKMNVDGRGSFTEILKTEKCGQFSVNISKPGIIKGQHWHHTKWEIFVVVAGKGLIRQRRIGTDEVLNFKVSGDKLEAVYLLPGYTHNLINLSETENLVTIMWANEQFDLNHPDTFFEIVE